MTFSMNPRIYTYKITFEEISHWYWGVHKEKKFNDGYMGSPVTHKWMWKFYTPKIQILELFDYTDKGYEEAFLVEERLIRPDLNKPLCLNEGIGMKCSLAIHRKTGKMVSDPNYLKGWNNPNHPKFGSGGRKGGKKACDPENPNGINNPDHPCYHERNKRNGERAILNQGKKVMITQVETGVSRVYPSIRSAARDLNLLSGALTNVLNPDRPEKTHRGFTAIKLHE